MIYFYHSPLMPLFVLTAFAKYRRTDLSQAECKGLRELIARLKNIYLKGSRS